MAANGWMYGLVCFDSGGAGDVRPVGGMSAGLRVGFLFSRSHSTASPPLAVPFCFATFFYI